MKILGQETTSDFTVTRSFLRPDGSEMTLKLAPLPLRFQSRLYQREIVAPVPPQRVARDSKGRPVKDREGLAVLIKDEHDGEYLAAMADYQQQLAVLMVYEGLRHDADVSFESQPPENGSWKSFAEELCREFEAAGWSLGDLTRVCEEICRLSNLLDDHLRESEQVFSSPAPEVVAETPLRVHDP
ncbi:MAG: hypothetical protein HUJ26_08150 [Planctomycetaceae bacterium]|nr:hypothetical protein [Planctomycetaceae bacterium]